MKTLLILIVLLLGAAFRFGSLWNSSTHQVSAELIDAQRIARSAAVGDSHDELVGAEVQTLYFDPDAWVVVTNGEDAHPGRADVDDDFNGTVDDTSERGAFGSDDTCQVLPAGEDPRQQSDLPVTLLSRGGFVPQPAVSNSAANDPRRRYIVSDGKDANVWKFAIDP
ncbi:hypothetical protein SH528x_002870 [Novipirellula sp. SH528]|uniref:hypothetical protein n=1 Tax=Novipirellula sp. SH528 TaxID=3454466 RepID=UPI003FA0C7C5